MWFPLLNVTILVLSCGITFKFVYFNAPHVAHALPHFYVNEMILQWRFIYLVLKELTFSTIPSLHFNKLSSFLIEEIQKFQNKFCWFTLIKVLIWKNYTKNHKFTKRLQIQSIRKTQDQMKNSIVMPETKQLSSLKVQGRARRHWNS